MKTTLLKNANLFTLINDAPAKGDLRIFAGKVIERAAQLDPNEDDEIVDLKGRIVLPGFVCAHTHLYSALARGMPGPPRTPNNFHEILKYVWWRLDRALDEETIYWSAIAGAIDAIRTGSTTLIDHHASPGFITNSLAIVQEALSEVGLRGVLCYEVTDRGGEDERDLGIEENRRLLNEVRKSAEGLYRGLVGAHAAFTLNDDSLALLADLAKDFNAGVHIHVAEDKLDEDAAQADYQKRLIDRLGDAGILRKGSILAHCTHLTPEALQTATHNGCWIIHNPRSNMNNSVGYASVKNFGHNSALGTDGIGADMFEEAKFAFYKSHDAQQAIPAERVIEMLANGQRLAGELFNSKMDSLTVGASADLVVLDYHSPTPLTKDNFAWHFIFGMSAVHVRSVMVNGRFLLRDGNYETIDVEEAMSRAQRAAQTLWKKMSEL